MSKTPECEHTWRFANTVYWAGRYPLPGSDARERMYGDRYFCEKCLETQIKNERSEGNTYGQPVPGTFPR